jgi:hypothetical protein
MRLLKPPSLISARPIYGTAFKMSDSDVSIVESQLVGFLDNGVRMQERRAMIKIENKLQCFELFDHYAKSLSGD